jgi:molecular chaperone GrpE
VDGEMIDNDDVPERASEIDDVTNPVPRPESGAGDPPDDGTDEFDAIVGEIDYSEVDVPALLAEREEYKGLAQRVQADFENYRKRMAAQSLAEADRASGRLAEALLPVLDAAEAAYVRHPDEVGPLLNQMLSELKKHGLEALDLEQQPFDPEFAEAVAHEPGDGGEPIVAEVLRSGYTWKGKVLRAAMVRTKD